MSNDDIEYEPNNKELLDECLSIIESSTVKCVQPTTNNREALNRKKKLDEIAHLIELELIENDYINSYE